MKGATMFLPAKYIGTYSDRAAAMAVLGKFNKATVQELDESMQGTDFVFLDAEIDCGEFRAPAHFILHSKPEGVEVYFAQGHHLSSTAEGAHQAFADASIDQILKDGVELPVVCCVFELAYQGSENVRTLH